MTKMFKCVDCEETHSKTGRNQKRCSTCASIATKAAIHRWAVATGRYTGTGSGAHNTLNERHPQWRGGERKFEQVLAPNYFKKTRYCERCEVDLCDAPPAMRAVHHKDHNRLNNTESNFELLCRRYHQIEHECWRNLPNNRSR